MKKRPQHCLTKCLKPKNQHWMTKKPKAPRKIDYGPSKIKNFFVNEMTCCKNIKVFFETNSAVKKAYKFQWKKRPQHCLTKCLKPKKLTLSLEKTISPSKTNVFHWKTILDNKKPRAPWKINYLPAKNFIFSKKKRNDLLQKRKTIFENQICFQKSL